MDKIRSSNWKYWVMTAAVAVVAGILLWFAFSYKYQTSSPNSYTSQTQAPAVPGASHQFLGQVQSVGGSTLTILGTHILDSAPEKSDFNSKKTVMVTVTPDTKFVKTVWIKSGSSYQRVPQAGSLADIAKRKDLTVTVKTDDNSAYETTLTASEIDYNTQSY